MDQEPNKIAAPAVVNLTSPKAKKNTGLKIALICTSILSAAGIGFGIFSFIQNNQKDQEIKDFKANNAVQVNPSTTDTKSNAATTSTTITPADIIKTLSFDESKIVNKKEPSGGEKFTYSAGYHYDIEQEGQISEPSLAAPSSELNLLIFWPSITKDFSKSNEKKTLIFSQPVIESISSALGINKAILLFIMQDGSVSYMYVADILNGDLTVHENLGNIKNAVKFYEGSRYVTSATGGYAENNVFVQTTDGSIYSVIDILN